MTLFIWKFAEMTGNVMKGGTTHSKGARVGLEPPAIILPMREIKPCTSILCHTTGQIKPEYSPGLWWSRSNNQEQRNDRVCVCLCDITVGRVQTFNPEEVFLLSRHTETFKTSRKVVVLPLQTSDSDVSFKNSHITPRSESSCSSVCVSGVKQFFLYLHGSHGPRCVTDGLDGHNSNRRWWIKALVPSWEAVTGGEIY